MSSPLLTIVIPTYNRAECLSLLLTTLALELRGLEDKVELIVGNNASTDHTPIVIEAFLKLCPNAQILHNSENLGPDENFCRCIDQVKTRFFWMIGDDDLPKSGALRQIVNLLECEDTDILYLSSEWMPHITSSDDGEPITTLATIVLSREDFAQQVNVWVTFISGMVVNLERLYELNSGLSTRRFTGTSLVQLGWILPLLMTGSHFKIIEQRCILATSGNTGGYKLVTTFGGNFPVILHSVCGKNSAVTKQIEKHLIFSYLPGLIWISRFGEGGIFMSENLIKSVAPFRGYISYWLILFPVILLPKFLTRCVLFFSRMYFKLFK
ncbi:MAG: glycosyltransferase family 2 protein [Rhodoferax sp.]|uniref:glycosyltransferase family 2 protein n=1 Tax=Rhodoferax sp. TaxID=50421 RepID=UPI001854260D|nr:glycosyltransferase [Rhodoferax sp.]NMM13775.1 glycosyltransferase family 2 protein [Rhodoferax sp.]